MNTKREIRAELRILRKAAMKVERDVLAFCKVQRQQVRRSEAAMRRAELAAGSQQVRILKRIAILQGQLNHPSSF